MKFDLNNLVLDESGKLILGDDDLNALEKEHFVASAGGTAIPDSNWDFCSNAPNCIGQINYFHCIDTGIC